MAYTKECFAILITCLTQWWAPTVVRVSGDSSMLGQLVKKKDGSLQCKFADRMVLMANHQVCGCHCAVAFEFHWACQANIRQLYTDWLYLWWIAYTNSMHGFIYIILKESLKNIPIIGWGCQFYNFIFLSRKWEEDQSTFKKHLSKLNKASDPMWLIIFPEGTNLSATTREKSKQWAAKQGLKDMKHQLLPRSTGLRFCLTELRETTEWLYDCTIAYEGVPPGQFGQDIFTLRSSFFEGRPPKSVNMHWRRFHIDSIPVNNSKAFEVWLRNRWREKDYMLEYFQRNNRFPADDFWKEHLDMDSQSSAAGGKSLRSVPKPAIVIETEVKSGNWNEFVKIFAPITSVMMALSVAYGASPADLAIPGGKEFFEQHMKSLLSGGEMKGLPSPDELEKLIEGAARIGAKQEAKPENVGKVQQLTQENLAQLVKETAIKSGMVLPGGMRKVNTAIPAMTAPPQKARPAAAKPAPKAKSAVNLPSSAKKSVPATQKPAPKNQATAKPKPAPTGEMRDVMTTSGIMIKIPKTEVEQAKSTGTIITKNGLVIKIAKDEMEEAQKKKGSTIMTSGGVPIMISPSGGMTVQQKPGIKSQKSPVGATAAKPAPSPLPAKSTVKKAPVASKPAPKASVKQTGPQVVTKKDLVANGVAKKPASTVATKSPAPKLVAKKTGV